MGLAIPPRGASGAAGAGSTLMLVPVFGASGSRLNVGITEVTGRPTPWSRLHGATGALRALIPAPSGGRTPAGERHLPDGRCRTSCPTPRTGSRSASYRARRGESLRSRRRSTTPSNDGAYAGATVTRGTDLLPSTVARADGRFGAHYVTDLEDREHGSFTSARESSRCSQHQGGAFSPRGSSRSRASETRALPGRRRSDPALRSGLPDPSWARCASPRSTEARILASSRTYTAVAGSELRRRNRTLLPRRAARRRSRANARSHVPFVQLRAPAHERRVRRDGRRGDDAPASRS